MTILYMIGKRISREKLLFSVEMKRKAEVRVGELLPENTD